MKDLITKYVLKNAHDFGKARKGTIIGKLINENPEIKEKMKELSPIINETVERVNGMKKEEIEKEIAKRFPELLIKKEKEPEEKKLPNLPNAEIGKVVTRLPPEPNGYPHLGHALSFFINYLYSKKYEGKVWLRFEDTNPKSEKREFYEIIRNDIKWLGIEWDYEKNVSSDIPTIVEKGKELIGKGYAYMCTCPFEEVKKKRFDGKECKCRKNAKDKNQNLWDEMFSGKFKPGEISARLKIDMTHQNMVMRDPTIFRIIIDAHPLQGTEYTVYPTYDFANSIEDALCGVTHVLRSNEFAPRIELQNFIRTLLSYENPETIQYSRFSLMGTPTSKREIKKLVEEKKVSGWDDPRLSTLSGLRRRGIVPETLKTLTLQIGLSTSQPVISWENLLSINQKILDSQVDRYFFIPNPVKIIVKDAPSKKAKLKLHPTEDHGFREIETTGTFYVPGDEELKGEVRLKDLYNIKFTGNGVAEYTGNEIKKDIPKLQWVTDKYSEFTLIVSGILMKDGKYDSKSLKEVKGYGEIALSKVKPGTIVQLERVGFARVDSLGVLILTDLPRK